MTKKELLNISFEDYNENKLKLNLKNFLDEYGINKAFLFLSVNNRLLLNSCNIDENGFNQILFKNYIYSLYSNEKCNFENFDKKIDGVIKMFNNCIENNNFEEAFKIFANNNVIYQLLCSLYIKDLYKSEKNKINKIDDENINNVYNKLILLKNTDLSFKRENIKIHKKVSSK